MADWKPVKASSLSEPSRVLYREYVEKYQHTAALGQRLKEAVTADWNQKFPDGINGQECAFHVVNGMLQYVMKKQKKKLTKTKGQFDEELGDDVFGPRSVVAVGEELQGTGETIEPNVRVIHHDRQQNTSGAPDRTRKTLESLREQLEEPKPVERDPPVRRKPRM